MRLHDLVATSARVAPERPALDFATAGGDADRLSYGELVARARRVAAGLQARGIAPGDRVAFLLGNRPEFVVAHLGALMAGAVSLPINLAYRRREIAHMLADAEPRLLVSERAHVGLLDDLAPEERACLEDVLLAEETAAWEGEEDGFAAPAIGGDDLALLLYTSGTTGRSKGAMLAHNHLLATVTALLAAWRWSGDDVLLLTLPLFHTHGLVVGLHCALAAGATVLLRPRFDAAAAVAEIEGGRPTLFFGVPTMYIRLVEALERRGAPLDARAMRLFCSGSAPLDPETFAAFQALAGHAILERYGMTETGMLLSNPYAGERRPGTVGTPLPGVSLRVLDAADRDVATGGEGELVVRGANVFAGYWRAPEKTAESFWQDERGDRWFRTGDLARQDSDGVVTLLGRRTELILSGGFNVYPREIEEVLAALPGVREAAVVGRPHPEFGQVPVAYLVAEGPLDEAAVVASCKRELAGFKVPRQFRYVEALPRNALGKVQKHLLD